MKALSFLPWYDWLALVWFFGLWLGYAAYSRDSQRATLLQTTNRYRRYWMVQATARNPRMLDGIITQGLASSPSFFASTTILIIGGLLALLGATDKVADVMGEIPFAVRTSAQVFDLKVLLLTGIFIYAFFRFTWSMRQYTFAALVIGSMPDPEDFASGKYDRKHFADRAGKMLGMAAETFNDGLRAYYMSFAATAWVFSTMAFALAAAAVIFILFRREFHSEVLHVLRD
ncbi:DUF599 domain-containing protein [Pseudorhodoferax sp.]|uniref:DUF599 domain-containing protein n=1 Tax=Pseudorhodoferax sp. TaxID=1993553 RepID=UPI0039E2B7BD